MAFMQLGLGSGGNDPLRRARGSTKADTKPLSLGGGGGFQRAKKGSSYEDLVSNADPAYNRLTFTAYWNEPVLEGKEKTRCRIVYIVYIVEDGTITVMEKKVQNSGMPQGCFLKKHRVPNPNRRDGFYELQDLQPGKDVIFYGRKFHISCCDAKARQYCQRKGVECAPDEQVPEDTFEASRTRSQETKLQNTPMKEYMEASRGKAVGATKRLGLFLKNDGKVLKFQCHWDDRASYKGELHRYTLCYFLADKTIEILNAGSTEGSLGFSKLVSRIRLPKNYERDLHQIDKNKQDDRFYSDADLVIGAVINVYGKSVKLTACDDFTKEYYKESYGMVDSDLEAIILDADRAKPRAPAPALAPHLGGLASFGTAEDSAQSCLSLHPSKVKQDTKKLMANQGKQLRFVGRFANERPEDRGRRFVIAFYMADDTISVFEMANKNSGIVPGKFLRRMKIRYSDGRSGYVKAADLGLGKTVKLNNFEFLIDGMDQFTERFTVNIKEVLTRLHHAFLPDTGSASRQKAQDVVSRMDSSGNGFITAGALKNYVMQIIHEDVNDADLRVIMKFFDENRDGRIDCGEIFKFLQTDPDSWGEISAGDTVSTLNNEYQAKLRGWEDDADVMRRIKKVLRILGSAFSGKAHHLRQIFLKYDPGSTSNVSKRDFSLALNDAIGHVNGNVINQSHIGVLTGYFFPNDAKEMNYSQFMKLLERHAK